MTSLVITSTYEMISNEIHIFYDTSNIEYWCLTDLNKFVPSKRLDHFMETKETKDFIQKVSQEITPGVAVVIQKRGRGGGTYAHELVALKFIAWLSPDFELHVYKTYNDHRKNNDEWSKERIITKYEFRLLTDTIKDQLAPNYSKDKQGIPYGLELGMINRIVFGTTKSNDTKSLRDTATITQLKEISELEHHDKTLITMGLSLEDREKILRDLLSKLRRTISNSHLITK